MLKTGTDVEIFFIISIIILCVSFFYTFPAIDEVIESCSNEMLQFILDEFILYIVIALQVVVIFLPAIFYTWIWGTVKVVER